MSYQKEEAIRRLVQVIKHHTAKAQPYLNQIIEDSETWNIPLFIAEVLWSSHRPIKTTDRKSFDTFVKKYNSKNEPVEVDSLFKRFWLREVVGVIHIPSTLRSILNDYKKYEEHLNELQFLSEVQGQEQVWNVGKFREQATKFSMERGIKVDSVWILESGFIKKSEGKETFTIRFSEHYSTLVCHRKDFQFLNYMKQQFQESSDHQITLETKRFALILDRHKKVYPSTPDLAYFIDKQFLTLKKNEYIIQNLYDTDFFSAHDKDCMTTLLWRKLCHENPNGKPSKIVRELMDILHTISYNFVFGDKLTQQEQKIFLDGALELILSEPDIKGREDEYKKCLLDSSYRASNISYRPPLQQNENLEHAKDIVDLFERMNHLEKQLQNNLFFDQSCRHTLYFLIRNIIKMDVPYVRIEGAGAERTEHFPAINKLLRESLEAPFLIWSIYHFLGWVRPEVIPYLLLEPEYDTLAFFLLTSYRNEHTYEDINYEIRTKILVDAFELSLSKRLQSNAITLKENAEFLFRILNRLNKDKFEKNVVGRDVAKAIKAHAQIAKRESEILKTIERFQENGFYVHTHDPNYFLPKVLPDLLEYIVNYEEKPIFAIGTIRFPLIKFDMLSWLAKYVMYNSHLPEFSKQPQLEKSLGESFVQLYLDTVETDSVEKMDFDTKTLRTGIPSWSESSERIEKIEWWPIFILVYRTGNLKELLAPQFRFTKTDDKYEERNRFNAKKLRTHLTVLMLALDGIGENPHGQLLSDLEIEELIGTIEYQLIDYVEGFGTTGNRFNVNIFDEFYDRSFFNLNDQLLPKIVELGNSFKDRNRLWKVLSFSNNLHQLLILVDHTETSGFKTFLLEKIKAINIGAFLHEGNWSEVQSVYYHLSKHRELTKEAEITSAYWKDNGPKNGLGHDFEKRVFESQLINAYTKKDEAAIDAVEEPKNVVSGPSELKPFEEKRFYKALVRFENDPKTAYRIFDDLLKMKPNYLSIALNRFAAKISWAKTENNTILFREALQEWYAFAESKIEEELEFIKDKIAYNILTTHLHLKNTFAFNQVYSDLDHTTQLNPDFVELKVTSLLEQKREEEAKALVQKSMEFNTYKNFENEHLKNLFQKLAASNGSEKTIKELITHILPKHSKNALKERLKEDFMASDLFGKNLSKEIALSLEIMLRDINTIDKLGHENEYNDILRIILAEKLKQYGLTVSDQSRGGYSESGKSAGSRDITILEDTRELTVIEPFKYTSKAVIQSHISKVFNYTPNREFLFVVLYDFGEAHTLEERWDKYRDNTLAALEYPKGFDLAANSIEDISEELGFKNNAVKIAFSLHGKGTRLFHILVNVSYKVI